RAEGPSVFATSAPADAGRSRSATRPPAATRRSAVARPSPEAPPVTTAFTLRSSMGPSSGAILAAAQDVVAPRRPTPTSAVLSDTRQVIRICIHHGRRGVGPPRRDHGDHRPPLVRSHEPLHSLPARRHASGSDRRPRRRRPDVRSRLRHASGGGSSVPPLGALRWPSRPGAPCRRPARPLSGLRADRARSRQSAAAPAVRPGVAAGVGGRVSGFACVWVECFVAAAVERPEPALRAAPLAVVAPAPSVTRVVDANPAAREYGVRAGVTETEARARCPTLVSRPFVREHVAAARHALLEAARGVSPRVEDGGAGLVYVDAVGLTWLHGDPAAVGRRLVRQARGV